METAPFLAAIVAEYSWLAGRLVSLDKITFREVRKTEV